MSTLTIEESDEALAEALKDCVVGQQKTITIDITPLVHDNGMLVAKIDSVAYSEPEAPVEEEAPVAPEKRPYKPAVAAV